VKTISALVFSIIILLTASSSIQAVSSYYKYNNNPVLDLSPSGWDSKSIMRPNVIYDKDHYKMYYAGSDGNKFQIGMATSTDGIFWTKYPNNPIIPIPPGVNNLYDPMVIATESGYIMWYEAHKLSGGPDGFKFYRAISSNGIDWTTNPTTPIIFQSGGSISEYQVAPTIIYDKNINKYKMWYTSLLNSVWSISYAESIDGITWINNPNNPIIKSDQLWEGTHLSGPTVYFDNNLYHLWYTTNSGNVGMLYTYSSNGINNWIKPGPPINPILQPNQNIFDSIYVDDGSALKIGSSIFIWYGGTNLPVTQDFLGYRIGLASSDPFPIETTTPTPTSTPIPTLTNTPIPTLTPTPIPSPTPQITKTIVIPGLGGSWNFDSITNCNPNSYVGNWIAMPTSEAIYNPILEAIRGTGNDTVAFYYDWRRPPQETAEKLKTYIDNLTQPNEKINLIGHSLGGLVGRAYIEKYHNDKVAKFIAIASPFQGALTAYPAWEGDKIVSDDIRWKTMARVVMYFCADRYHTQSNIVKKYLPSVQYLLPTFDYIQNQNSSTLKPVTSMYAQNTWLPNLNFQPPFYGIPVKIIVGTGYQTINSFIVKKQTGWQKILQQWRDGEITNTNRTSKDGDGTVLTKSATLNGSDTTQINKNHIAIMSSQDTISLILSFLGFQSLNKRSINLPLTHSQDELKPDSALVLIGNPGFSITSKEGQTIQDTNGLIFILNPKNGDYKLLLSPKEQRKMKLHIFQFTADTEEKHKEYDFDRNYFRDKKIRWNKEKPFDDPIN
jgi:pimeloyl-ACP methyl ester carboxylesterase